MTDPQLEMFDGPTGESPQRGLPHRIKVELGPRNYRPRETDRCCGNCAHHFIHEHSKRYHKCELVGDSMRQATDVRALWVCDIWTQKGDKQNEPGRLAE